MNRLCVSHFCRRNNGGHIQVTQRRRSRSNANRLVGQFDVLGITICFGIDHDGLDIHFSAGPLNAQRNLAPVGDQDFFEHGGTRKGLLNDEQGLTILNRLTVVTQDAGDRSGLIGFDFVEDFHCLDDTNGLAFFDGITDLDKCLSAWGG